MKAIGKLNAMKLYNGAFVAQLALLLLIPISLSAATSKVLDFGPKLQEFVKENPNKGWLIKFYAPWCHHCQQLEPVFISVAEQIYHKHDDLIVGRIDCSKNHHVCETYGVQAYPSIIYLNKDTRATYKGDRSVRSIVDFAERLDGPDVKTARDCEHLRALTDQHGMVVFSGEKDESSVYFQVFKLLASSLKHTYWFYRLAKPCKRMVIGQVHLQNGLYLFKKHLKRPTQLDQQTWLEWVHTKENADLVQKVTDWIRNESFPVFGPISGRDLERTLASGKLLVIAILDEYRPARKFAPSSSDLYKTIEKFAKEYAERGEKILFAWSSDLDLIQSIAIRRVAMPNLMLLRNNFTYYLHLKDQQDAEVETKTSEKLLGPNVKKLIEAAKSGKLEFEGGDSYLHQILRYMYGHYSRLSTMYTANPLLATILLGFPASVLAFIIYSTCTGEGESLDRMDYENLPTDSGSEDDDDEHESDNRHTAGRGRGHPSRGSHAKQD